MYIEDKLNSQEKRIITLVYCFVFLAILSDIPIIIFFTLTKSVTMTKALLYGTEFVIMMILVYMVVKPFDLRLPHTIYLYGAYILAMAMVSIFFYKTYDVLRSSRQFLAPLPPLVLGYYFGFYFREQREKYIDKLIKFLTIMSVIGLVEWLWWGISQNSIMSFYSKFFDIGSYYQHIRQSSFLDNSGLMIAGIRPSGNIIPGVIKRVTGFYFEPFAAGFNASLAVVLILYRRVTGCKRLKWEYIFLGINIIAVILTTSRSSYLFLTIFLLSYMLIRGKLHPVMILCLLPLFYGPFREFCSNSISSLGGGAHRDAVIGLPDFIWSYFGSFEFLWGCGFGSMENNIFSIESGYGAIFGQLGMIGIFVIVVLYLSITMIPNRSAEDRFFTFGFLGATLILLFFANYPFGYKTYGLIQLFLGTTIAKRNYCCQGAKVRKIALV